VSALGRKFFLWRSSLISAHRRRAKPETSVEKALFVTLKSFCSLVYLFYRVYNWRQTIENIHAPLTLRQTASRDMNSICKSCQNLVLSALFLIECFFPPKGIDEPILKRPSYCFSYLSKRTRLSIQLAPTPKHARR
jgi:hypothetical protein